VDLNALKGFMQKIFTDLKITPNNYRLILTLPRRIDKKCRQSILELLFHTFEMRSVLMCHQSVISFWAHSAENGIVVDIGERCDIIPVSQGFVLGHAWGRAPFGGHVLKHSLRQGLGPQVLLDHFNTYDSGWICQVHNPPPSLPNNPQRD